MKTVNVGKPVEGGVEIPFSATCTVNRRAFAGKITVTWHHRAVVPEYDSLARLVRKITTRPTTCEGLAIALRERLRPRFKTGVTVRVDVTSEAHLRAWAVRS